MSTISSPQGITHFRLAALKKAVHLESLGMKHSSGTCMRKVACRELGLDARTKAAAVITAIEEAIAKLLQSDKGLQP